MTSRVIGNIILMQFSVWVHENSSDSLWQKNLNSEEQWCIKVMQNTLKKANTHLFLWNRKSRGEEEWEINLYRGSLSFKVHPHPLFLCCSGCVAPPADNLDELWPQYKLIRLIDFKWYVFTIIFVILTVQIMLLFSILEKKPILLSAVRRKFKLILPQFRTCSVF